mmetsp:Transcript_113834/g.367807  ORF Transcript_113834/g.367807 Transcript_113834/m.367807 type:complete len:220 (+) Transcript_113834:1804-2463(+)
MTLHGPYFIASWWLPARQGRPPRRISCAGRRSPWPRTPLRGHQCRAAARCWASSGMTPRAGGWACGAVQREAEWASMHQARLQAAASCPFRSCARGPLCASHRAGTCGRSCKTSSCRRSYTSAALARHGTCAKWPRSTAGQACHSRVSRREPHSRCWAPQPWPLSRRLLGAAALTPQERPASSRCRAVTWCGPPRRGRRPWAWRLGSQHWRRAWAVAPM